MGTATNVVIVVSTFALRIFGIRIILTYPSSEMKGGI